MNSEKGSIEVICGPVFCGKTDELLRLLRQFKVAKRKAQVFLPNSPWIGDALSQLDQLTSHDGLRVQVTVVIIQTADEIPNLLDPETAVVMIDQVQFFAPRLVEVCRNLAERGIRVVAAGLDMDFRGEPYETTSRLLAIAGTLKKLSAICPVCTNVAIFSQRLIDGQPTTEGDQEIGSEAVVTYEPRCGEHHVVPGKPQPP